MRKRVFVHIGAPAAGANILPQNVGANRETLRRAGIELLDALAARR